MFLYFRKVKSVKSSTFLSLIESTYSLFYRLKCKPLYKTTYKFKDCTSLKEVIIPNSVESIGDRAFRGCTNLKEVNIPNSVKSIGDEAFKDCSSLQTVIIPNSVESIGYKAFEGTPWEENKQ